MPNYDKKKKMPEAPMPRPDKKTRQNVQREIDAEEARAKMYGEEYRSQGGKMGVDPVYAKAGCKVYNNR